MRFVTLPGHTDLDAWKTAARALAADEVPPDEVAWTVAGEDLIAGAASPSASGRAPFSVPAAFIALAGEVILHRCDERFDLLYRLLCRLRETPGLLLDTTDPDVARARSLAHQVSKASHKMKAFVRFRRVAGEPEAYCAWFEPPHRVLHRTAPFFIDRFANQRFSILTPDACLDWDLQTARFAPGVARPPGGEDGLEACWLTYYASIFNPARLKVRAMQAEMPKRYWRNLPEAALIPSLVAEAQERSRSMVAQQPTTPLRRVPPRPKGLEGGEAADAGSLPAIARSIQACRRCDLWCGATQGVAGTGPAHAPLMLVGEQPGDQEDLAGAPFVGPAGQMLDRALAAAGIDREAAFVTNAVKHFKHEVRGKRRLHKTPDAGEIRACRWWLEQERSLVRPALVVALGATAAMAVFGKAMPVMKSRGRLIDLDGGGQGMVTVHPSFLLRVPDAASKAKEFQAFVADLEVARRRLAQLAA
ncbi:MAG TPA: UdgX family uracil-DNA binding protein [Caulobacteraceae bacterium]|nr:UdgX family uracil-DNA binding protein [Caulobacteraceae bacterium]